MISFRCWSRSWIRWNRSTRTAFGARARRASTGAFGFVAAHPLDDLNQLATIGLDNEVDRQAVGGPCLGRPDDGHQRSSGSNQACGPLLDVAADDIEHQIDSADVFQGVVLEVDELLRAEVERRLTVGRASGADNIGAGLSCELRHHRTDCAGRTMHEDALSRLKAAVLEQSLPRGQARDRQARAHREVDVARQRREVACLDGTYSARVPSRCQSARPNTRCPTDSPVVP